MLFLKTVFQAKKPSIRMHHKGRDRIGIHSYYMIRELPSGPEVEEVGHGTEVRDDHVH